MGDTSEHFSEPRCAAGSMYPIYPGVHVGIVSHTEDIARHRQRIKFAEEAVKKIQAACTHQFAHKDAEQRRVAKILPDVLIRRLISIGYEVALPPEDFPVRCERCWLEIDLSIPDRCPKCLATMTTILIKGKMLHTLVDPKKGGNDKWWGYQAFRCANTACGFLIVYEPPFVHDEQ